MQRTYQQHSSLKRTKIAVIRNKMPVSGNDKNNACHPESPLAVFANGVRDLLLVCIRSVGTDVNRENRFRVAPSHPRLPAPSPTRKLSTGSCKSTGRLEHTNSGGQNAASISGLESSIDEIL